MEENDFKKLTITDPLVFAVWQKGNPIPGFDGSIYKTDNEGYIMEYSRYGQERTFGWEIEMKVPAEEGGTDNISNFIPVCREGIKKRNKEALEAAGNISNKAAAK